VIAQRPSRLERALPWAAVAAAAWLTLFPITSVDAYYHLATGRHILETRTIPTRGVGSASFGRAPWHDNEWGFQVLAALVGRSERGPSGVLELTPSGRAGLIVMRAAACAATLAILAATMAGLGVGGAPAALAVWLAAFLTFGNLFWDVRPQILSYLALAALAWQLERFHAGRRWALPASLGVVALWANVHGAVVLGFVLLACETAGAWIESWRDRPRRAGAWRLAVVTLAAPLAACLNPLGWRQVLHPLLYATRPEIYANNNEWTRPDLLHLPLLATSAALLAAALFAGARPRPGHLLRLASFGVLFLTALRHLPFLVIVAVPVGALSLTQAARLGGWRLWLNPLGGPARAVWARATAAVLLASAVAALSGAKFVGLMPRFEERGSRPLPEAQARFLALREISGAGFNGYRFGGFLMFRLYPREVVVMDGRNDLYGAFRNEVYNRILFAQPGWEPLWREVVRRYDVGWVLVDVGDPLAAALSSDPEWLRVPDQGLAADSESAWQGFALFLAATDGNRRILASATEPRR
jgi:hypothetical protein